MKKMFRILGLTMAVVAILAVAIAGTVSAAGGDTGKGAQTQTQNQGEVCPCGDCVCGDCEPNSHNYLAPGPHGVQQGISD